MGDIVKHSATAAAEGFVYQFYEAIDWCHKLKEGQRLYIESFGDIAVSEDSNIEVKNVSGTLTDKDECFWKTLGNWLETTFHEQDYSQLILLTTQKTSSHSKFKNWNLKNLDEKASIVEEIIKKDELDYNERVRKYNESDNKKNKPKKHSHIERVRSNNDDEKLKRILAKFTIADSCPLIGERYKELCDLYCKSILKKNATSYMNSLVGFIISPQSRSRSWCISYDDFCEELRHLTQTYSSGSRVFPRSKNTSVVSGEYAEHMFVNKIRDILHFEAIDCACTDYANSLLIINESFSSGEPRNRFNAYLYDVKNAFDVLYRMRSRRCTNEVELDSQDFYDEFTISQPPSFPGYDSTQTSFRNGVIHIQMDDPCLENKWRLK